MQGTISRLAPLAMAIAVVVAQSAYAAPRDTAKCLIKRDPSGAKDLARARPGSGRDDAAASSLLERGAGCPDAARMLADPVARLQIGGAIAEQLYAKENRNIFDRRFATPREWLLDSTGERMLAGARDWPRNVATISCGTMRDPQSAYLLLRTKPGSARELAAVQALAPAIQRCVGTGERMAFDRATVRAVVARHFYTDGFAGDRPAAAR